MVRRLVVLTLLLLNPACGSQRHYADEPSPPVNCTEPSGPLLSNVSSVYAGSAMTCAIVSGRVACWGVNDRGRLGDGFDKVRRDRPVFVAGIEQAAEITYGNRATFARLSHGTIFVWGSNRGGEFGDGSPDFHIAWTPRAIAEWGAVKQIQGGIPVCALRHDGQVVCAGKPRFRSMGEDPAAAGGKPVIVPGLGNIVSVAAGSGFSCALRRDGKVYCWGMDDEGQLGDGGGDDQSKPVEVNGLDAAVEIVAGGDSACARLKRGGVRCWGRALTGSELGGEVPKWTSPETISGTEDATQISLGDRVACAVMKNADVRCWGESSYDGQLGDGTTATRPTTARPVACIHDAIQVSVGDNHSCVLLRNGTLRCWGSGSYGAIGDGTHEIRKVPVAVLDAVSADPPPERCPPETTFQRGPDSENEKLGIVMDVCLTKDKQREGLYESRYPTGGFFHVGTYQHGLREGKWSLYYEHGDVVSEEFYVGGEPHGLWIAYSLRYLFAFATCFDHGRKMWQVTERNEAMARACP